MQRSCPSCGEEALFTHEAVYDGFTKVGDSYTCTACGDRFEELPEENTRPDALTATFGEVEAPEDVRLVGQDDPVEFCRHCTHYVVNAFTQRCGLHMKVVAATDSCPQFQRKPEDEDGEEKVLF